MGFGCWLKVSNNLMKLFQCPLLVWEFLLFKLTMQLQKYDEPGICLGKRNGSNTHNLKWWGDVKTKKAVARSFSVIPAFCGGLCSLGSPLWYEGAAAGPTQSPFEESLYLWRARKPWCLHTPTHAHLRLSCSAFQLLPDVWHILCSQMSLAIFHVFVPLSVCCLLSGNMYVFRALVLPCCKITFLH